jgi:hypothetical protein
MNTKAYTVPYVAGWATGIPNLEPVEVIKQTGEKVRKTALQILKMLPTWQTEETN